MKIDFDHYQGARIAEQSLANEQFEGQLMIIQRLQPKLGKDGKQWVYLLGEMPEHYLAGWGDTPYLAMEDFVRNFYTQKLSTEPQEPKQ